jgi:predicted acetyltransferase
VGDDTFLGHYGAARPQLKILGTHPLFRHRGAASMLVCAGLERARAQGVPTTVLASPMGYKLYISLGFKAVGMFIVRIEGEEEKLDIGAMEHRGGLWSLVGKSKCEEKFEAELSAQG